MNMSEADLARIEAMLGKKLPQAFRRVMLNFPQEIIEAATITDGDGNPYVDDMMISPNAEAIMAAIAAYPREPDWPESYLVVGCNGCGEEYSVDISDEKCPVYESGPHNEAQASGPSENGYFEQCSDDLESWVKSLAYRARRTLAGDSPFQVP
jgi:hypothetical protein